MSVDDPRNPVDLDKYDGELAWKEVTISAPVKRPDGQTVDEDPRLSRCSARLDRRQVINGRWIITGISDASVSGATPHS